MEQQLHRYFLGLVGFAFVVTWATVGATDAIVATIVCLAGANLHQLLPRLDGRQLRSQRGHRPPRARLSARPLRAEHLHSHELVPDDPSLIIGT